MRSALTNNQHAQTLIIEAGRAQGGYWADMWRYRELFYFLAWRDVLVRYKQTVIGIAWALIRPFLTMVVFTVIFGKVAHLPSGGAPYAVMVFAGMLPWQLFAGALTDCGSSVVANTSLVSKVYFPRMIVPASSVGVNLVDFTISLTILCALMAYYRFAPGWQIIFLPAFLLLAILIAFGMGLWLSALTVKYRDFRHVVPFIVQLGMYISPVGFSTSIVHDEWRLLYFTNPMVAVIDGFRWAILGGEMTIYWPGFAISLALTLVILALGLRYFRQTERTFADVI